MVTNRDSPVIWDVHTDQSHVQHSPAEIKPPSVNFMRSPIPRLHVQPLTTAFHSFFPTRKHPHEHIQCNASTDATTISLGHPNCDRTPESHRVFEECHRWPQDHHANQAVTTPEHGQPHMPKSNPIAPRQLCPQTQHRRFRPGFSYCDEAQEHGRFCGPPPSDFTREDNQSDPGSWTQFWVGPLLASTSCVEGHAVRC